MDFEVSLFPESNEDSKDAHIKESHFVITQTIRDIDEYWDRLASKPKKSDDFLAAKEKLEAAISTAKRASEDQREFIKNLKLEETLTILSSALENPKIWGDG